MPVEVRQESFRHVCNAFKTELSGDDGVLQLFIANAGELCVHENAFNVCFEIFIQKRKFPATCKSLCAKWGWGLI